MHRDTGQSKRDSSVLHKCVGFKILPDFILPNVCFCPTVKENVNEFQCYVKRLTVEGKRADNHRLIH